MGERTINFGQDATDADYQVRDSDPAGGDLIIEHLPTGATFEYDSSENAWIPTDPIGTANRKASPITTTSVDTEEADITNETYVEAYLSSDKTGLSSGSFVNILDTEVADSRNEFNSSQEFVPDETGKYTVLGQARINPGSDGDLLQSVIRNVSDSTNVAFPQTTTVGSTNDTNVGFYWSGDLTAGKSYEFQAQDFSSSFSIASGEDNTRIVVIRGVVHP